jgi:enoyl-CoA hydratase/carnithine racemase
MSATQKGGHVNRPATDIGTDRTVQRSIQGAIATITLNRPHVRNALTRDMIERLIETMHELATNPAIRVVVLTGADPAFCAGDDLRDATSQSPQEFAAVVEQLQRLTTTLFDLGKPVIAAINGAARGGGLELTLAADLRIAGQSATFACPEISFGLTATNGASVLLPRLIGAGRASEMLLTGRVYDATWALSVGLVSSVVPDDQLMEHATETAELIASGSPLATDLTRGLLREETSDLLSTMLAAELAACTTAYDSADTQARLAQFRVGPEETR